jgi:hypothetical protein
MAKFHNTPSQPMVGHGGTFLSYKLHREDCGTGWPRHKARFYLKNNVKGLAKCIKG